MFRTRSIVLRVFLLIFFKLGYGELLSAQGTFHVFPQLADGRFADQTSYRSTLIIIPWFEGDAPQCTLTLYGMSATFAGGSNSSSFTVSVPAAGSVAMQTTGLQSFQGGYGTLSCNAKVFASLLYAFYAPNGVKLGEATVFSTNESVKFRMIADHREGARFAIAIANNTDSQQAYLVTYIAGGVTVSTTVAVPARRSVSKFLDEITSVTAGSVGVVTITSTTLSNFSVTGLRFTGGVFTTVPPS